MTNSLGIYIHIPFCNKKCSYCNFYSFAATDSIKECFVDRTLNELEKWGTRSVCPIDTIYLGGGTPSVLSPCLIKKILNGIFDNFILSKDVEITCEVNPGDDIKSLAESFSSMGINRVSIGMQSANPEELRLLGRRHSFEDVKNAVRLFKDNGIENISVDLIIGLPDSTISSLDFSIDAALSLQVPHISSYILKIEENTPLFLNKKLLNLASEDEVCNQYLHLCKRLEDSGFEHYEISNFAKFGKKSRHNMRYWEGKEYIGIGPSAYSYFEGDRFHYPANINEYIEKSEIVFDEKGGGLEEFVMLNLRLNSGLNLEKLCHDFSISNPSVLFKLGEKLAASGLCIFDNNQLRLTNNGMLVSNSIILEILGALNENL